MLNVFTNPTPKHFFYLTIAYVISAGILAYFLLGGIIVFMASIMSVHLIATAYHLQKVEKVRDKQKLSKQWFHCFAIPFGLVFYLVMYSGFLFREEFVLQKDQLQQVSGIIPDKHTYESRRSGKSSRSFYYLTINNINFHCSEDDFDDCENIYVYKGKDATVHYQPNTKNGNLVYEIIVNDVKPLAVYQFDNQLKSFQENRKKENSQLIFAFVLYFLPAFYFLILYRGMVAQLQEMNDDEKEVFDKENNKQNIQNQYIKIKDFGVFGFVSFVIGIILFSFSLVVALIFFLDKSIGMLIVFLIILIISIAMICLPYKIGKRNRDIRLGYVDDGNHKENFGNNNFYFSTDSNGYNLSNEQNRETSLENLNYSSFPNSKKDEYSKNYHQDNNESQSIKLKDFGIFGILTLLFGSFLTLFSFLGFVVSLSKSIFGMSLFWFGIAFVSSLMIYKPYQSAKLNRDIRIGLYDYEEYDDEYQEPSLFYRVFRILSLFTLIPIFWLFFYFIISNIIDGKIMNTIIAIFILFPIGYGIKKLW